MKEERERLRVELGRSRDELSSVQSTHLPQQALERCGRGREGEVYLCLPTGRMIF